MIEHAIKHIIFDFDLTISAEHLHGAANYYFLNVNPAAYKMPLDQAALDQLWQYLLSTNALITTGDAHDWQRIFTVLIASGYHVSIASFSSYPTLIERFLREIVKLPPDVMQKIYRIEAWLPERPEIADKNTHLQQILRIENDEITSGFEQIILIDDSSTNTNAVKKTLKSDGEKHILLVESGSMQNPRRVMQELTYRLGITF